MVQGQNFHVLNAGKILTWGKEEEEEEEENNNNNNNNNNIYYTIFTQGFGQDHKI